MKKNVFVSVAFTTACCAGAVWYGKREGMRRKRDRSIDTSIHRYIDIWKNIDRGQRDTETETETEIEYIDRDRANLGFS